MAVCRCTSPRRRREAMTRPPRCTAMTALAGPDLPEKTTAQQPQRRRPLEERTKRTAGSRLFFLQGALAPRLDSIQLFYVGGAAFNQGHFRDPGQDSLAMQLSYGERSEAAHG